PAARTISLHTALPTSAAYRAIVAPVSMDSSSGWACTNSTRRSAMRPSLTGGSHAERRGPGATDRVPRLAVLARRTRTSCEGPGWPVVPTVRERGHAGPGRPVTSGLALLAPKESRTVREGRVAGRPRPAWAPHAESRDGRSGPGSPTSP